MSKAYNEIMKRMEVTEEMRQRIMVRVCATEQSTKHKAIPFSSWRRYTVLAACLTVVLVGIFAGLKLMQPPPEEIPPVQVENGMLEYTSAEELSEAVGFSVSQVNSLPFTVSKTEYLSYWGKLAEISYSGANGERAVYRISAGPEDNSGDYNTYPSTQTITVGSLTVKLKGSEGIYTLANWTEGTCAYSLHLSAGENTTTWSTIIESIQ